MISTLLALSLAATTNCGPQGGAGDTNALGGDLLRAEDRVVLIGDTFAERAALFGYLETLLRAGRPRLTVRNLGWSADTVALRPRPFGFDDLHEHLSRVQADVILLCFGMSDSFAGPEGLDAFSAGLQGLVDELRSHTFGEVAPRLVLVSPIPHEDLGPPLPDPAEHARSLVAYAAGVRRVAAANGLPFVDLYASVHELHAEGGGALTFNGIHANAYGAWVLGRQVAEALGARAEPWVVEADARVGDARAQGAEVARARVGRELVALEVLVSTLCPPSSRAGAQPHPSLLPARATVAVRGLAAGSYALAVDGVEVARADHEAWADGVAFTDAPGAAAAEGVRELVLEKERLFFQRWRPVNGEYVFGRRREPFGVENFPAEMQELDRLVDELDARIADEIDAARRRSLRLSPLP